MAKGISVHVGVNKAKPEFDVTPLRGCRNDAEEMFKIATANGFEATAPFLDDMARLENVKAAILDAAGRLEAGDIFLFTFAGHGSVRSTSFSTEELDSQDEEILLHDGILIDNYLRRCLWSEFKKDVRILGIADSCHSGTVLASIPDDPGAPPPPGPITVLAGGPGGPSTAVSPTTATFRRRERGLEDPPIVGQPIPVIGKGDRAFSETDKQRILDKNPQIHNDMRAELELKPVKPLEAKLLTLGACRDRELARDGAQHGVFTQALMDVWAEGAFQGRYDDFIDQIADRVLLSNPSQHSVLRPIDRDEDFVKQRPFTINL